MSKEKHSDEYKKGYHCGYVTASKKFKGKDIVSIPEPTKDFRRLINLAEIPPQITWYSIGDEECHRCSNCDSVYEWIVPFRFCPECGGRSQFADLEVLPNTDSPEAQGVE